MITVGAPYSAWGALGCLLLAVAILTTGFAFGARSSFRQLLPLARPRSCPSLPPASTNTLCEATFLLKFMCDWEDIMY